MSDADGPEGCVWREGSHGMWETSCGHAFDLNEGTPWDNRMLWCCYCGEPLRQEPYRPCATSTS